MIFFENDRCEGGWLDLQDFRRGDADGDGACDITDAIFLLQYLFASGPAPLCADAADADDSGYLDIVDPVWILFHIFVGSDLPAPSPSCGPDPTEDWLLCATYSNCAPPREPGLVYIRPGQFLMGSPEAEPGRSTDETLHPVIISCGFFIGATEVTQDQYMEVMGKYPRCDCDPQRCGKPGHPAYTISWQEADDYCRRLSMTEGRTYRLPTEAEWEYCCRAGTRTRFWFGDALDLVDSNPTGTVCQEYADVFSCTCLPLLVAQKKPNPWGLYDVHDLCVEWCSDWYGDRYPPGTAIDPTGPESPLDPIFPARVLRGIDYWMAYGGRSAARGRSSFLTPQSANGGCQFGFRVVLEVFKKPYLP